MFDDLDPALALLSGRLLLRRPRLEDAPAVARLANDRKIAENTATIPHPYGLADAEAFVLKARGERKGVPFAVFRQEDGVLVGAGGVSSREREDAPEIGYWIGAPYRGNGYATEVVRAMVDFVFEELVPERLAARCRVTNSDSRRVLEKCGFQWCGTGLENSVGMRGSFPVDRFRLERTVWASLRAWGRARPVSLGEALPDHVPAK